MGEKRDQGTVPGEPEERANSDWFEDHPTPEELSAYQAGELTPEQSDAIQEHLAGCELCTEVLLDLHRFLDLPEEDRPREGVVDLQTETEWRALKAKLPLTQDRRSARRSTYAALAAILLVAVGFSFYVLSRSPERYKTLVAQNETRGAGEVETVQPPVTLLLKVPSKTRYPEYQANLQRGDGSPVREFSRLKQLSSFEVKVPIENLDIGAYQIKLLGIRNGAPSSVGTYVFKVASH